MVHHVAFQFSPTTTTTTTTTTTSSRDETLRPLVQTASPTRCGNVASASIGRYTLSSAEFGAQLTFLRLGSVLQSVYSINRAQRKIHPTSAQLPYQTAKAKCFSRFSARQSCGTCSGTRFLTSASRRVSARRSRMLEHSSLLSDALRDACAHQRSICISWLDLKNGVWQCETLAHHLALQYYGFPEHFIQLVRSYYDHLSVTVVVPGILSTNAIHFALGVFQRMQRCHRLFLTSLFSLLWTVLNRSSVVTNSPLTQRRFCSHQPMRMTFSL